MFLCVLGPSIVSTRSSLFIAAAVAAAVCPGVDAVYAIELNGGLPASVGNVSLFSSSIYWFVVLGSVGIIPTHQSSARRTNTTHRCEQHAGTNIDTKIIVPYKTKKKHECISLRMDLFDCVFGKSFQFRI